MVEKGPVRHLTDLQVWKLPRELRNEWYALIKLLLVEEKYNLVDQIRRDAVSVTANIAEGYGRYHYQANIQFCRQSRGSLYEIQDHLITCLDHKYFSQDKFNHFNDLVLNTIKALDGYIRYLNKQKTKNAK